jgi:hypothetical protein
VRQERKKKKPRSETVTGVTNGKVTKLTFTYDELSDSVTFHEVDPSSLKVEKSYERDGKNEKVLVQVPVFGKNSTFNATREIIRNYADIVAVDTNSKEVAGRKLSVSASYFAGQPKTDGSIPIIPITSYLILDIEDENMNPERIGWHLFLQNRTNEEKFKGRRLAIITDSHLGDLSVKIEI